MDAETRRRLESMAADFSNRSDAASTRAERATSGHEADYHEGRSEAWGAAAALLRGLLKKP